MINHTPYTYLIGWPVLNKWYYGVRYAKNCQPDDLWISYKTSSKFVKNFVTEHGDPTIIEVRKTFQSISEAQQWESKVLKRLQVTKSPMWLNAHDSRAFDPTTVPRGNNHWTKKNTEVASKWRNREGWKRKGRKVEQQKDKQNLGMPCGNDHWTAKDTDAAKQHHSRMIGSGNPNYLPHVKARKSKYLKENNPVFNEEVRKKISASLLGRKRPRKICEHCKKDIADSVYTKFHGNNCRNKIKPMPDIS
jgi:hypothetical protein